MSATLLALFAMTVSADHSKWQPLAEQALAVIETHFWNPETRQYALNLDSSGHRQAQPAYLWDTGVVLSAYAAVARVNAERGTKLVDRWLEIHRPYWESAGPVAGYNTHPRAAKPDRYYDDNAWVALALCEAYEATGHSRFLTEAERVHSFVASGEDEKLSGGIYWRELKDTKNTCAIGNAALTALKLHAATKNPKYAQQADRWLLWLEKLRDSDGLYFDHMRLDGSIERTKWSYNSALPLRAYLLRYRQRGNRDDLVQAVRIARAAKLYWQDPNTGAIRCDAAFAHNLVDAWVELDSSAPRGGWRQGAERALEYMSSPAMRSGEFFSARWERAEFPGRHQLLWNASAARSLWFASR